MNHVMHDLETYGNTPGCIILSIGAVRFGPEGVDDATAFYTVISMASCRGFGLHDDPDTVAWWEKQSPAARKVIDEAMSPDAVPLDVALQNYAEWLAGIGNIKDLMVWGNGSDFDNAIVAAACRKVNRKLPWFFWNNRCFRTLKNLGGPAAPERGKGTKHNALDDAIAQAWHAVDIINKLKFD